MAKLAHDIVTSVLDYGELLSFGTAGSVGRLLITGFDLNDGQNHSWTEKQTAEIEFGLRLPSDRVTLYIEALPFTCPGVVAQQVFIFFNGLLLGFQTLLEKCELKLAVDRGMISTRTNRLTFVIPTAASPKALGLADDVRQLGIALISLRFILG